MREYLVGEKLGIPGRGTFEIAKVIPASDVGRATAALEAVVIVYPAIDGPRWQLWSNSRIMADGGQAYSRRSRAQHAAEHVFAGLYPIVVVKAL